MTPEQIKALQQRLRAAGYDVKVDGVLGDGTRTAKAEYEAGLDAKKAESAAQSDRAKADAAKSSAEAERAKADAEKTRAATDALRLKAEEKRRSDEAGATARKQMFDTGTMVAAWMSGLYIGKTGAEKLNKTFEAGVIAKNAELAKSAKRIDPLIAKIESETGKGAKQRLATANKRLAGAVAAADMNGLTKTGRGGAGPITGTGLIAMGQLTRYYASQIENETGAAVLNALGTAETVAGGVILTADLAGRSSPTKVLDGKSLSIVEEGRALTAADKAVTAGGKVLRGAARVALPLVAAAAAVLAFRTSAQAGESPSKATGQAAVAAGDVVTGGAFSFYRQASDAGYSPARSAAEAAVRGVYNAATFGMFADTLDVPVRDAPRRYLNANARAVAAARPLRQAAVTAPHTMPLGASDGLTSSYQRHGPRGSVVSVRGYQTPLR